jgi:hypothetical protein
MTIERMNDLTRRAFLKAGSLVAAGARLSLPDPPGRPLDPSTLKPFVDPLPIPRIAKPLGTRPDPDHPNRQIPYYRIAMREIQPEDPSRSASDAHVEFQRQLSRPHHRNTERRRNDC